MSANQPLSQLDAPSTDANDVSVAPCYDIFVRKSLWADERRIREKALLDQLIPADKLDKLLTALRQSPRIKVGGAVEREKAYKAKQGFEAAGLEVDLVPVLSLQKKVDPTVDSREDCPACGEKVLLAPERQCPACTVFVDKVTDEQRLRRKIMNQERDRVRHLKAREAENNEKRQREQFEAELRKKIREEIEEEMGLHTPKPGAFGGYTGVIKVVGILATLGGAFAAGHWEGGLNTKEILAQTQPLNSAQRVDQLLSKMGLPNLVGTGAGAGGDAAEQAAALQAEDSLVSSVQAGKAQGKGLSVEQALAATPGAVASGGSVALPVPQKAEFGAELVRLLAQTGQLPRAREVLKALRATPAYVADVDTAAVLSQLDLELRAWTLAEAPQARQRALIDALRTDAVALPDPLMRTRTLLHIAVILAGSPTLPPEAHVAFFTLAREAMGTLTEVAHKEQALGEFLVSTARVLLAEEEVKARAGAWVRAKAISKELEALISQAPTPEFATQLAALDIRGKLRLAHRDEAVTRLVTTLDQLDQDANLPQRAQYLRILADDSELLSHERFQASLNRLAVAADAKVGTAQAQVMVQLALIYADAGQADKQETYSKRAQAVPSLKPEELLQIQANLLVSRDIAAARRLSRAQAYVEVEAHIQRVAGYLL